MHNQAAGRLYKIPRGVTYFLRDLSRRIRTSTTLAMSVAWVILTSHRHLLTLHLPGLDKDARIVLSAEEAVILSDPDPTCGISPLVRPSLFKARLG
jgi:hypothetical protein